MEHTIVTLEPQRQNDLLKWWSAPESGTLLDCLEKSHKVELLNAVTMQAKAAADPSNQHLKASAEETLAAANAIETTIRVLKYFIPNGPFIARIEL